VATALTHGIAEYDIAAGMALMRAAGGLSTRWQLIEPAG
jgi:fructose-1,6-bisphosphatase/inositol monophosphatase family enzyme